MFREFALTLTIAVVVSAIVSLTLTPMMCSRLLRHAGGAGRQAGRALLQRRWSTAPSTATGAACDWVLRPPDADAAGDAGDARRHRLALRRHAEGLPAAAGHRPDLRGDRRPAPRSRSREMQRLQAQVEDAIRKDPDVTGVVSVVGVSRDQPDAQRRPPRHHAASRATSAASGVDDVIDAAEAGGRAHPRHDRLLPAGAGHPDQHPRQPRAVPVHAGRHRRRARSSNGPTSSPHGCASDAGAARRRLGGAGGRPAHAGQRRPREGRPARRLDAGDQRHAQRRLRPAADFDHLRAGQPVPRDPRGAAALPAGSGSLSKLYVTGSSTATAPWRRSATGRRHHQHQHLGTPNAVTGSNQVPLSTFARFEHDHRRRLSIAHQEQFPAVTISFNLAPGAALSDAVAAIIAARARRSACRRR